MVSSAIFLISRLIIGLSENLSPQGTQRTTEESSAYTMAGRTMPGRTMAEFRTISDLAPRLRVREISPVEITLDCLQRNEKLNPTLNAFITVMADSALAEARAA